MPAALRARAPRARISSDAAAQFGPRSRGRRARALQVSGGVGSLRVLVLLVFFLFRNGGGWHDGGRGWHVGHCAGSERGVERLNRQGCVTHIPTKKFRQRHHMNWRSVCSTGGSGWSGSVARGCGGAVGHDGCEVETHVLITWAAWSWPDEQIGIRNFGATQLRSGAPGGAIRCGGCLGILCWS